MCGIIAYTGHRPAVPLMVDGLRQLEYRGYDSAGVAFVQNKKLHRIRAKGKLSALEEKLGEKPNMYALSGIGHTRWATHGVPAEHNAHPHLGGDGSLALVHNGIFENYLELKAMLSDKGYTFQSETDTEVVAHLIAEGRKHTDTLFAAFAWALRQVEGAYSVAMVALDEPETIYAARMNAPLLLGVGTKEHFVASDIPAFLAHTRDVVFIEDGELVRLTPNTWELFDIHSLEPLVRDTQRIQWDIQSAQKGGYKHFMLKEIFEQPRVIQDCLVGRLTADYKTAVESPCVQLPELDGIPTPRRIHILACGTSYNAGLWAAHLFESWAQIPVSVEVASEFRYRDVVLESDDLVLAVSQSGETADTLAALRLAKEKGCCTLGLCNVVGSSIAREVDTAIITQAGPEISVASTKAMCSQMVLLTLMAIYYGQRKQLLSHKNAVSHLDTLLSLPIILKELLPELRMTAKHLAKSYASAKNFFFLGRGHAYPLALEGALKLTEISYIHAEGYAAGEMKHGPIALIDETFPTLVVVFDDRLMPKTASNILEIQARNGAVIALTNPDLNIKADHQWIIPAIEGSLVAFAALPALQLFSYEMADYLGKDVDQPRNLAKSVTVE